MGTRIVITEEKYRRLFLSEQRVSDANNLVNPVPVQKTPQVEITDPRKYREKYGPDDILKGSKGFSNLLKRWDGITPNLLEKIDFLGENHYSDIFEPALKKVNKQKGLNLTYNNYDVDDSKTTKLDKYKYLWDVIQSDYPQGINYVNQNYSTINKQRERLLYPQGKPKPSTKNTEEDFTYTDGVTPKFGSDENGGYTQYKNYYKDPKTNSVTYTRYYSNGDIYEIVGGENGMKVWKGQQKYSSSGTDQTQFVKRDVNTNNISYKPSDTDYQERLMEPLPSDRTGQGGEFQPLQKPIRPTGKRHDWNCKTSTMQACKKRNMVATTVTEKGKWWDEYYKTDSYWDNTEYTECICQHGTVKEEKKEIFDPYYGEVEIINTYFEPQGAQISQGNFMDPTHPLYKSQQVEKERQFYADRREIQKIQRGWWVDSWTDQDWIDVISIALYLIPTPITWGIATGLEGINAIKSFSKGEYTDGWIRSIALIGGALLSKALSSSYKASKVTYEEVSNFIGKSGKNITDPNMFKETLIQGREKLSKEGQKLLDELLSGIKNNDQGLLELQKSMKEVIDEADKLVKQGMDEKAALKQVGKKKFGDSIFDWAHWAPTTAKEGRVLALLYGGMMLHQYRGWTNTKDKLISMGATEDEVIEFLDKLSESFNVQTEEELKEMIDKFSDALDEFDAATKGPILPIYKNSTQNCNVSFELIEDEDLNNKINDEGIVVKAGGNYDYRLYPSDINDDSCWGYVKGKTDKIYKKGNCKTVVTILKNYCKGNKSNITSEEGNTCLKLMGGKDSDKAFNFMERLLIENDDEVTPKELDIDFDMIIDSIWD